MNFKLALSALLCASALSASSSVFANEYQTFAELNYLSLDVEGNGENENGNGYSLSFNHFFDKKQSLGPLSEFDYINRESHAFAAYYDFEDDSAFAIGGNYFAGRFLIGATYEDNDDYDSKSFSLGYLISRDFLVKVTATDPDFSDTSYNLSAQYNHQLDGNDYLGFTYSTDEEFDYQSISGTYFTRLEGERYLKLEAAYYDSDFDDTWEIGASYYLNNMTSVSLGTSEESDYTLGARHFFNNNFSIQADYFTTEEFGVEVDLWQIGVTAQF